MAGILGYGAYIPRFRLKAEDIWDMWINPIDTPTVIKERRGLTEKAVDQDPARMPSNLLRGIHCQKYPSSANGTLKL